MAPVASAFRSSARVLLPGPFARHLHHKLSVLSFSPQVATFKTKSIAAFATMSLKRKAAEAATDATKKSKPNGSITAFFGAPKKIDSVTAKFDKQEWISKLTDEQKDLLKLEIDTLHDSWLPHLKDVLLSPTFLELKRFLKKELASGKTVYPPMRDVYSWYVCI